MTDQQENITNIIPSGSVEDESNNSIVKTTTDLKREFEEDINRLQDLEENDYDIYYKANRIKLKEAFHQLYLEQELEGHNDEDLNTYIILSYYYYFIIFLTFYIIVELFLISYTTIFFAI